MSKLPRINLTQVRIWNKNVELQLQLLKKDRFYGNNISTKLNYLKEFFKIQWKDLWALKIVKILNFTMKNSSRIYNLFMLIKFPSMLVMSMISCNPKQMILIGLLSIIRLLFPMSLQLKYFSLVVSKKPLIYFKERKRHMLAFMKEQNLLFEI